MKTIHKFPLPVADDLTIAMPWCAEILCVQVQRGEPQLWVRLDDDLRHHSRTIQVRGTGRDCTDTGDYVGSYQLADGDLVFHVFDGGFGR